MRPIRVYVGLVPRMVGELFVEAVERQTDMMVAGQSSDPAEILMAAATGSTEVVLLGLPGRFDVLELARQILTENSSLVVIAISVAEDRAMVYRREVVVREISASEESVVAAIRSVGRQLTH